MTDRSPLADLCLAVVDPYVRAKCELYPIRITIESSGDYKRSQIRDDVARLWFALVELHRREGIALDMTERDFLLIGWMDLARPSWISEDRVASACNLLACVPDLAHHQGYLAELVAKHKEELLNACPRFIDIQIQVPEPINSDAEVLLDDPFYDRRVALEDIVIMTEDVAELLPESERKPRPV